MKLRLSAAAATALIVLVAPASGQPPGTQSEGVSVTVVPFEAIGNVDPSLARVVASEIESLISSAVRKTVSQGSLNANAFVQSCGQETCELQTTHRLRGSLSAVGSLYIVRVRLEIAGGGKLLYEGNRRLEQNDEMLLLAVEDIAGNIMDCLQIRNCEDKQSPSLHSSVVASTLLVRPVMAEMIEIPAGEFLYGDKGLFTSPEKMSLPTFRIDKTEVTVEAYAACVKATRCQPLPSVQGKDCGSRDTNYFPMNCVTWREAKTYCEWVGKRLPTAKEWEKAARGTDDRTYPWGEEKPTCDRVIMDADSTWGNGNEGCGKRRAWSVCSRMEGNSPYGLCDMAGNLWEWTSDWERTSKTAVLRGGSWENASPRNFQVTAETHLKPTERMSYVGFRCVQDVK